VLRDIAGVPPDAREHVGRHRELEHEAGEVEPDDSSSGAALRVIGYGMGSSRHVLRTLLLGSRWGIAGGVYGAIVVMGTITAGSAGQTKSAWELAVVTAGTVVVLWLAHVYAHSLGESLEQEHTVTRRELAGVAWRESSILLAAAGPILALILGAVDVIEEATAVWVALGIGVATLGAQGLRYAQRERMGRPGTLVAVSVNVALGLVIVAMKAVVAH
jgi:hypothetical protein